MSQLADRIKEAAKIYRQGGWNVIPLRNYEKPPSSYNSVMPVYWEHFLTDELREDDPIAQGELLEQWKRHQGWKPYQYRISTDTEFERMFAPDDITGLGVITGKVSNLYVLDEDSYKEGGKQVIRKSPLISATANGGRHYFFKFDESVAQIGLKNKVFIEGKGEGGFIVLPPSIVLKKDSQEKGGYTWIQKCKIADIPTISKADTAFYKTDEATVGETIPWGEVMEVPKGSRHNDMRTLMIKKLNATKPEDWDSFLWNEIQMYNNGYQPPIGTDPSDKKDDLDILWRDCKSFVLKNPPNWLRRYQDKNKSGATTPSVPDEIAPPRSSMDIAKERVSDRQIEKEAASTGYRELDYLVKGFIQGHLYTITGETNIGKTAMCANFAVRTAQQGKNVLYIALEPDTMISEYVASIVHRKRYDELTDEDIISAAQQDGHISYYGLKEIPTPDHLVKAIAKENQYQLIIIDHVGYFVRDQRNVYQEQANIIKQLANLAKQKNIPIMMVAHINKEASKRNKSLTYNDISGSAAFKQDSTDVWILERLVKKGKEEKDDKGWKDYLEEGKIKVCKSKSGKNGEVTVFFREGKALVEEGSEGVEDYI
jgi:archaellum biogenesis ATPase FlaH